jgi:hypothetical protein
LFRAAQATAATGREDQDSEGALVTKWYTHTSRIPDLGATRREKEAVLVDTMYKPDEASGQCESRRLNASALGYAASSSGLHECTSRFF